MEIVQDNIDSVRIAVDKSRLIFGLVCCLSLGSIFSPVLTSAAELNLMLRSPSVGSSLLSGATYFPGGNPANLVDHNGYGNFRLQGPFIVTRIRNTRYFADKFDRFVEAELRRETSLASADAEEALAQLNSISRPHISESRLGFSLSLPKLPVGLGAYLIRYEIANKTLQRSGISDISNPASVQYGYQVIQKKITIIESGTELAKGFKLGKSGFQWINVGLRPKVMITRTQKMKGDPLLVHQAGITPSSLSSSAFNIDAGINLKWKYDWLFGLEANNLLEHSVLFASPEREKSTLGPELHAGVSYMSGKLMVTTSAELNPRHSLVDEPKSQKLSMLLGYTALSWVGFSGGIDIDRFERKYPGIRLGITIQYRHVNLEAGYADSRLDQTSAINFRTMF